MNCGTARTGETGETSETSGTVEKAGRIEKAGKAGKAGSASQSQRIHGAGYVGAIVGQVRRVGLVRRVGQVGRVGVFFCFCGLSFVICNYFVSLSLENYNWKKHNS